MKMLGFLLWFGMSFLIGESYEVQCQYCRADFVHVKKHEWRCQARININEHQNVPALVDNAPEHDGTLNPVVIGEELHVEDPLINNREANADVLNSSETRDEGHHCYQCYCGRYFESLRGFTCNQ